MLLLNPFLIPLLAALLSAAAYRRPRLLATVNFGAALALLLSAVALFLAVAQQGRLSLALGGWPTPYAIEFAADGLSALLVVAIALLYGAVLLYQWQWQEAPPARGLYPLLHGLVAACAALTLAADLFNLYVWFELLLMALLGLLVLGGAARHREAAFKYFVLSMLGTLLLLTAVGLIHGATGQLNFEALREASRDPQLSAALPLYSGLLVAALLLKVGAFPLFAWLPAAYHTLPAPLLALVGGLLTKLGVYVLLRLSGQVFDIGVFHEALGWLAMLTLLSGVLGAAYHWDLRRILAFHIVSQIGYLLLGVALASSAAAAATGFFLLHNLLVKANLFLLAGLMWRATGHYDLRLSGGLYPARPFLAILFLISAFSLVGAPPSSGFWGKYGLLHEAFVQQRYVWAGIALLTGLLTLYSMSKIWLEGFWKAHPDGIAPSAPLPVSAYAGVIILSVVIVLMGVAPEPLLSFLQQQGTAFWRPL